MRTILSKSDPLPIDSSKNGTDPIYLVCQFFIHRDKSRRKEIQYCLQKNCENPLIHTIFLLNEKIYSEKELGVSDTRKIKQINIQKRLTFKSVFDFIRSESIHGFVVIVNSDIMVDHTIEKLHYSRLSTTKSMIALLRYEYDDVYVPFDTNCDQSKIFGPRADSQDTWIIHSSQNVPTNHLSLFDFPFGKPGCDNKMVFLFHFLGYRVYNDPVAIRTYHFHTTKLRDYGVTDTLLPIFEYLCPYGMDDAVYRDAATQTQNYTRWNFQDNDRFHDILTELMETNKPFVIPAVDNLLINSKRYDEVYQLCDYFFSRDGYSGQIKNFVESEKYTNHVFSNKNTLWESLRAIPNFMFCKPWIHALQGKRILIVSPYAAKIERNSRKKIYPMELFRENSFVFVKWDREIQPQNNIAMVSTELLKRSQEYDVALVDADAFTNVICCNLYKIGKSSIAMGNWLGLCFGIYNGTHENILNHVFRLFRNEKWVRVD